jgi:hypothetical protein
MQGTESIEFQISDFRFQMNAGDRESSAISTEKPSEIGVHLKSNRFSSEI